MIETTEPAKYCSKCRRLFPLTEYYKNKINGKYYLRSYCKECVRKRDIVYDIDVKQLIEAFKQAREEYL